MTSIHMLRYLIINSEYDCAHRGKDSLVEEEFAVGKIEVVVFAYD